MKKLVDCDQYNFINNFKHMNFDSELKKFLEMYKNNYDFYKYVNNKIKFWTFNVPHFYNPIPILYATDKKNIYISKSCHFIQIFNHYVMYNSIFDIIISWLQTLKTLKKNRNIYINCPLTNYKLFFDFLNYITQYFDNFNYNTSINAFYGNNLSMIISLEKFKDNYKDDNQKIIDYLNNNKYDVVTMFEN